MLRVTYLADESVSLDEVKAHCRIDSDEEDDLLGAVIIPSALAMCENRTGSAIRQMEVTETVRSGQPLSFGMVKEVVEAKVEGHIISCEQVTKARRTYIFAETDKDIVVRYEAGIKLEDYPDVKSWVLLACGWLYNNRELKAESAPAHFDLLLSKVMVPNSF